jgi:hypothetical protein
VGPLGGFCPRCEQPLIEPASATDREALVGQECHIVSAAPNGPRHGPAPPNGYDALDNLVRLCGSYHDIVDGQPDTFPVEALRRLKADHQRRILATCPRRRPPARDLDSAAAECAARGRSVRSQVIELISGTEDFIFDHDQPGSVTDAEVIASLAQDLEYADVLLDLGPSETVRFSQLSIAV